LSEERLCRRGSAIQRDIGRQLKLGEHKLISFAQRQQGLIVPPGNPLGLSGVADLARSGVVFVNRAPATGTRLLLDELLLQVRVAPTAIAGSRTEEATHMSVAATVAAGIANTGFGLRAAAERFGLSFVPVLTEAYFVVCRKASLDSFALQALIDVLKSENFRRLVDAVPGYASAGSGEIVSLRRTLPWYK
jgi:putative molybdopterin biosynthesis protein